MDFFNSNGGLMGSVRRASDSAISLFKNRAELAVLELKEENARLVSAAIWAGILIFSSIMAVIAVSCALLFFFWDQKMFVAIGLSAFFLLGTIVALFLVKRRLKNPAPFAETIAQFKKDRAWLQS